MLEIGFHERETALEFVTLQFEHLRRERDENVRASRDADHKAAALILDRLRDRAESDGTRFSGYAPVLIAVATRIATERNPIALVNALEEGVEALSLNDIVDDILDREKTKLEGLEFEDSELQEGLYGKAEQVEITRSQTGRGHDHRLRCSAVSSRRKRSSELGRARSCGRRSSR